MRIGTKLASVAGGLVLAALPLATASAAAAPQPQGVTAAHAQPAGAVTSAAKFYCVDNNHGAYVCFEPYGDKVWVDDYLPNHYSAAAHWKTNYGRTGTCYDSTSDNKWHVCNYNMKEGKRITLWAVNVKRSTNTWKYWSTGLTEII